MDMLEADGEADIAAFPKNPWGIPEPLPAREGPAGRRRADWSSLAEDAAARRAAGRTVRAGAGVEEAKGDGAGLAVAAAPADAPAALDLVLLPGVAFDARGARLGHGKGFYDCFIRRVRTRHSALGLPSPTLVALALDEQVVGQGEDGGEEVPMTELDERVDMVVTPTRVIDVRGKGEREGSGGSIVLD